MADIDKDALTKACEAFADAEVESGRMPKFHEDSIEAAILAYESAKEAKRKTPEEVAEEILAKCWVDGRPYAPIVWLQSITAAIKADRRG